MKNKIKENIFVVLTIITIIIFFSANFIFPKIIIYWFVGLSFVFFITMKLLIKFYPPKDDKEKMNENI